MNGGIGFGELRNMGGLRDVAALMRDPNGIAALLNEDHAETGDSPAAIFADIVNTTRADNRKIGEAVGVDIDADLMTPERAAHLLAGTVNGDGIELVVMFNELAEQRTTILDALLDPEEFEAFHQQKHAIMHTHPTESGSESESEEE